MTTGSNDQNPVTVTTREALIAALSGTDAKTIYVKGTILFDGVVNIKGAANKTVYGLAGSVLQNSIHSADPQESGILLFEECYNIILRNLTFKSAGAYDIDSSVIMEVKDGLLKRITYMVHCLCHFLIRWNKGFDN